MPSRTIQSLMDEVRTLGRYEAPFITDAELTKIVNSKIATFRQLILALDESRILKSATINISAGTASYSLPSDCGALIAAVVANTRSGSGYSELSRINWRDRYRLGKGGSDKYSACYCVRGDRKIWLWPTPAFTDTLYIDYLDTFTELAANATYDPGIDGWDSWIVYSALEVCAAKGRDETAGWEKLRKDQESLFIFTSRADRASPQAMSPTLPPSRDWRY